MLRVGITIVLFNSNMTNLCYSVDVAKGLFQDLLFDSSLTSLFSLKVVHDFSKLKHG